MLALCLALAPDEAAAGETAAEKTGLLVIAHGSRRAAWNEVFRDLDRQVAQRLDKSLFAGSRVAFMEMAEPTIAQVVRQMEEEGYTRIVAVPVFTAPSGHSMFDIPAILGLYHEDKLSVELEAEGIEKVHAQIPITLTATMSRTDLLKEILLDRVEAISSKPEEEALVLLVHGSKDFDQFWDRMILEIGMEVCGRTGITYFDWAGVAVGQKFREEGLPVLKKAAARRHRVLVVGVYQGLSAKRMLKGFSKGRNGENAELLEDLPLVASDESILPDERVVVWILKSAAAAVQEQAR